MNALKQLHVKPNDDLRELASLYALDALAQEEKAAYEAHLGAGCVVCVAEVASFRKVTGAVGLSVDPLSPRPELRERLMKAVAKMAQPPAGNSPGVLYDKDGVLIARPAEMNWTAGALPGVFLKVLFSDAARGYTTAVVRMAPGTRYPSHKHVGVEELYLLEGDLSVDDLAMRAGDYCRGEAGSIHKEIVTGQGCLFIVTSSTHDQLLCRRSRSISAKDSALLAPRSANLRHWLATDLFHSSVAVPPGCLGFQVLLRITMARS